MTHPSDILETLNMMRSLLLQGKNRVWDAPYGIFRETPLRMLDGLARLASGAYTDADLHDPLDMPPSDRTEYGPNRFDCNRCGATCKVTYLPNLCLCVSCMREFLVAHPGRTVEFRKVHGLPLVSLRSMQTPLHYWMHMLRLPSPDDPSVPPLLTIYVNVRPITVSAYGNGRTWDLRDIPGEPWTTVHRPQPSTNSREAVRCDWNVALPYIQRTLDRLTA